MPADSTTDDHEQGVPEVCILLATYNGARFLKPCLDSLLDQSHPNCTLYVRDDGSTDETRAVLREYAARSPALRVELGQNLGVIDSFFELLRMSSGTSYYAFADQDDVWMREKIARGVALLGPLDPAAPALYCGPVYLTDEHLKVLGRSGRALRRASFRNALIQNSAQGATTIINQAARRLLLESRPEAARLLMFDWWVYLVVTGFGSVVCDDEPYMYYRQHGANLIGTSASRVLNRTRALRSFLFSDAIARTVEQARQLERRLGPRLPHEHKRQLERFVNSRASFASRVGYALTGEARRNTAFGTLAYRIASIVR